MMALVYIPHKHIQTNRHTLQYANNDSKEASFTRIRKRKRNTKARSMGCRAIDFMQFAHFAWTDRKMKWKPNIYFARYLSYSWAHAIFFSLLFSVCARLFSLLSQLSAGFYASLRATSCLFLANTSFDSFSATFLLTVQSQPYNHWSLRVKKENECIPSNGTKVQTNRNNVTFSMYNFEDEK